MKLKKNYFICFLLFTLIFCISCTSTYETLDNTKRADNSNEIEILKKCEENISIASPNALKEVLSMLSESDAVKSEIGEVYYFISYQLLKNIFPVVLGDIEEPQLSGTVYNNIFSQITAGEMPVLKQEDINFLTIMILPTVVLFSDNKNIEKVSLDYIDQAIQMNNKSVLPLYLKGFIKEKNLQYEEALDSYTKALELAPSCYAAELGIARIYVKTDKKSSSLEIMDLLVAQYPYSVEIISTAAKTYFQENDYQKALELTSGILKIEPGKPEILLLRAKIFLQEGNIQQAARLIEVIERGKWENPELIIIKASISRNNGDLTTEIKLLEEGLKKYPKNKNIKQSYGTALMKNGQKEEARKILDDSTNSEAADAEGFIALIDDAIESGDWDKATKLSEKLALEYPTLEVGLKIWSVWFLQDKKEKALETAEKLNKIFINNFEVSIIYIKSLLSLKRINDAQKMIDSILVTEEDPEKRSILYYLKSTTLKNNEQKLQLLRSALFEDLKNIDALLAITKLYNKIGDKRKAYRYLKQAYIITPENKEIKAELEKLEKEVE